MDISFVSGVIAGSNSKLLTPSHLKNFENISRKDFLALLKTHQYGFASDLSIDLIMLEEEKKHRQYLESIIDRDHFIFKVLYLTFDHLFLSSLMKSQQLGLKYQKPIDGLSNFNETRYEAYIIDQVVGLLDLEDKAFLDQLITETKNLDAQAISDRVIKILHNRIVQSTDKKTDPYVLKYFDFETTLLNIMLIIRSNKYNKNLSYVEMNVLEGGMIDKHILLDLFNQSIAEIGKYLSLHFDERLTDLFKYMDRPDFLARLKDGFDLYMNDLLEDLSFQNMNLGPVIAFTVLKRREIENLKQRYYQIKE
jgi:V/A-type H+-transporting ATPase subunit C